MTAFYNEHDPYAADWLRNLIEAGLIAPGVVDERDIRDIRPEELVRFTQCHFFAGIGVWSYALRRAGWPDDRPIWTGSCPCQPFSAAGKGDGEDDERHLWPAWHWLIDQCRPPVFVGEQVASKDGLNWLDLVLSDAEASGYAATATDICAAGFSGAHIRQRLYLVGVDDGIFAGLEGLGRHGDFAARWVEGARRSAAAAGAAGRLVDPAGERREVALLDGRGSGSATGKREANVDRGAGPPRGLADAEGRGCGVVGDAARPGSGGHVDSGRDADGGLGHAASEGEGRRGLHGSGEGAREDGKRAPDQFGGSSDSLYGLASGSGGGDADSGLANPDRERVRGPAHRDDDGAPAEVRGEVQLERLRPDSGPVDVGAGGVADPELQRRDEGIAGDVGDAEGAGLECGLVPDRRGASGEVAGHGHNSERAGGGDRPHAPMLGRNPADWLFCRDGKWRPVEPGSFPLVDAPPRRVGPDGTVETQPRTETLRCYGNGLDAETATQFLEVVIEILSEIFGLIDSTETA